MKQKVELFVHVLTDINRGSALSIHSLSMARLEGYHLLCTQTVEFDVPEFDLVQIQVDGIEKQIVQIRADSQMQITTLEGRKQELLAIGVDV
jgi:hypothetical protein